MMVQRGGGEGGQDDNEDGINKEDVNYNVGKGSGPAKRRRTAKSMTLADNHVLDNNNLQDSDEDKDNNGNDGGSGKTIRSRRRDDV